MGISPKSTGRRPGPTPFYAPFRCDLILIPSRRIELVVAHVQAGRTGTATKLYWDHSVMAQLDPTPDDPDPQPQMFFHQGFMRLGDDA